MTGRYASSVNMSHSYIDYGQALALPQYSTIAEHMKAQKTLAAKHVYPLHTGSWGESLGSSCVRTFDQIPSEPTSRSASTLVPSESMPVTPAPAAASSTSAQCT